MATVYRKVFRFMTTTEKVLLSFGETIENHTDHGKIRGDKYSTSKGFCFGIGGKDAAIQQSRFLKGITVMDYVMVADVDESKMKVGEGRYATDFDEEGYPKGFAMRKELYTERMTITDFVDVHFYPIYGIRIRGGNKYDRLTVILPPLTATGKERHLLKLYNNFTRNETDKFSYYNHGEEHLTEYLDFTRLPIPKV